MSDCKKRESQGAVFSTYGEYRQHQFCQNICSVNKSKEFCLKEDCSGIIAFTTTNSAGNINIKSNFIVANDASSIKITTGDNNHMITIEDVSNIITTTDLSFNTDDLIFDISNDISIDSSNISLETTMINKEIINNTKLFSNLFDISGLTNVYISNDALNIDISSESTITIANNSFKFEVSTTDSSLVRIQDLTNNKIYDINGLNGGNACSIL